MQASQSRRLVIASLIGLIIIMGFMLYHSYYDKWSHEDTLLANIQVDLEFIDLNISGIQKRHDEMGYKELRSDLDKVSSFFEAFISKVNIGSVYISDDIPGDMDVKLIIAAISGWPFMNISQYNGVLAERHISASFPIWDGDTQVKYLGSFAEDGMLSDGELMFLTELKFDLAVLNEAIGAERRSMRRFNVAFEAFAYKWRLSPGVWSPFNYLLGG